MVSKQCLCSACLKVEASLVGRGQRSTNHQDFWGLFLATALICSVTLAKSLISLCFNVYIDISAPGFLSVCLLNCSKATEHLCNDSSKPHYVPSSQGSDSYWLYRNCKIYKQTEKQTIPSPGDNYNQSYLHSHPICYQVIYSPVGLTHGRVPRRKALEM